MKIRKCHVTNSSSSSFICDICGREESGWDMGLYDAEMFECENGHVFCWDEALEINRDKVIKLILDEKYDLEEYNEEDLQKIDFVDLVKLIPDGIYYAPECICPICQFEHYTDSDMLRYLLKKYNLKAEDVLRDWKLLFKNYDNFEKYINTK